VSERSDRIELRGLRLVTLVGALPEEYERPQPLELDLDVEADLSVAGASDVLTDTIDYGALCDVVELTVIDGGHVALLEALAHRVAAAVLAADERVTAVTVVVRKVRPPVPQDLATSGVRVTRRR
jgi:dihydroneopterin aldolase